MCFIAIEKKESQHFPQTFKIITTEERERMFWHCFGVYLLKAACYKITCLKVEPEDFITDNSFIYKKI